MLKDQGVLLGAGILIAMVLAKMLTFAVCQSSGFIEGPIFPTLFIGGTAGIAAHVLFPGIPLGLAFSCMFAAVPGALVSAPFTLVLLAALVTLVGALQTAPILLAVITSYLVVGGVQRAIASRRASTPAASS